MTLHSLTEKVLKGEQITRDEALCLYDQPLDKLCESSAPSSTERAAAAPKTVNSVPNPPTTIQA